MAVLASWWFWRRHKAAREDDERLAPVIQAVVEKLIKQARDHAHSPTYPPYLASVRLRDELLYVEQRLSQRQRVWRRVERAVGTNSNVRTSLEVMGDGEEMIAWTWLGSL